MNWVELVLTVCGAYGTSGLADQIHNVAKEFGVERTMVLGIIVKESSCNTLAVGTSDDRGLMQVIPKWHKDRMEDLDVTDLYNPLQNIRVGTHFLAALGINEDPLDALVLYNGGYRRPTSSYYYAYDVLAKKGRYDASLENIRKNDE